MNKYSNGELDVASLQYNEQSYTGVLPVIYLYVWKLPRLFHTCIFAHILLFVHASDCNYANTVDLSSVW